MASNQTSNYQLNQWQPEDKVLREEFNADNSRVDEALRDLAEEVGARALQTEVDGLKSQLATKAAQSALDSLSASVTAGLAKKFGTDFSYLKTGNYVGNGANSISVSVGFRPSFLILICTSSEAGSYDYILGIGDASAQVLITKYTSQLITSSAFQFQPSGFTANFMQNNNGLNIKGWNYHYIAFR